MSLGDKLRKAASLFVELPPQDETASSPAYAGSVYANDELVPPRSSASAAVAAALAAGSDDTEAPTATPPASGGAKTIEQIVRDSDGPNLDEIAASLPSAAGALKSDGTLDFAALYSAANLPITPFTAEQTVDMLQSLPQALPLDMKRQTVQVTLSAMGKAIGATPESILADTSRKLAALAAYSDNFAQSTNAFASETEAEIAALMAQAEEKRSAILAARQQQTVISDQCTREADRLDDVLEFFSMDVFPSRLATTAPAS